MPASDPEDSVPNRNFSFLHSHFSSSQWNKSLSKVAIFLLSLFVSVCFRGVGGVNLWFCFIFLKRYSFIIPCREGFSPLWNKSNITRLMRGHRQALRQESGSLSWRERRPGTMMKKRSWNLGSYVKYEWRRRPCEGSMACGRSKVLGQCSSTRNEKRYFKQDGV